LIRKLFGLLCNLPVNFVLVQRNLIITKDGSHSVAIPEWQAFYHSVHGALQESLHVYIEAGFRYWLSQQTAATNCVVFEMGFGTGLNALLTFIEAEQIQQKIMYETVEAFPLEMSLVQQLNYCDALHRPDLMQAFESLHQCEWNKAIAITDNFTLRKVHTVLTNYSREEPINIIYYDAFAPSAQPELWIEPVFKQLYSLLAPGGILVTYCSKGMVRRALLAAGFRVEKIPGPRGKREMIRAEKATSCKPQASSNTNLAE
jgi:tRNA U34 5-methylaminomethyl-2-thiouridine-forming methyltransferase MnmC